MRVGFLLTSGKKMVPVLHNTLTIEVCGSMVFRCNAVDWTLIKYSSSVALMLPVVVGVLLFAKQKEMFSYQSW